MLPINQAKASGTTYYVDNCVNVGSDSYDGTEQTHTTGNTGPWLTIGHVNGLTFNPGDSILFERGCTWREQLTVPSSGNASSSITFGAYGSATTTLPIISGANVVTGWEAGIATTSFLTDPNLQGYWPMEQATGANAPDESGNGNTLTNNGGVAQSSTAEQASSSASFNGSSQYLSETDANLSAGFIGKYLTTNDNFTCGAWIQFPTVNSGSPLDFLSKGYPMKMESLYNGLGVQIADGGDYPIAAYYPGGGVLLANTWYHVVGRYQGSTNKQLSLFFNGVDVANTTGTQAVLTTGTDNFEVGTGPDGYFAGLIDDLWCFNRALTNTQISSIYTSSLAGGTDMSVSGYYASVSAQPNQVLEDGAPLTQVSSIDSLASGDWWWDSVHSYVWVYNNPSGHTMEASQRSTAVDIGDGNGYTGVSYVTINDLEVEMANSLSNISLFHAGTNNIIIDNVTSRYSGNVGIYLDPGVGGGEIVIENSTVYGNAESGIGAWGYNGASLGHETYIQNNDVYSNGEDGIKANGNYIIVQNNYVHDEGTSVLDAIGIHIYSDSAGDNTYGQHDIIRDNLITDTTLAPMETGETDHSGIETDAGTGYNEIYGNVIYGNQGPCLDIWGSNQDFFNNTCYGNLLNSTFSSGHAEINISANAGVGGSNTTNDIIENNIAYATGGNYAIYVDSESASSSLTIANNLFYAPSSTNWYYWSSGGGNNLSTFNGLTGLSNNLYANPLFVSTSTPNFALASSSPAIDAGLNLGSTYEWGLDPASTWPSSIILDNQNSNGTGWDIGAYVYPNQAILTVPTSTLSFSASYGSVATSSQPVVIMNAGPASSTLNWSATSIQPWLTFSPASSSLAGGASTTVNFIVNPSGLPVGATSTTATISDPNASSSPQTLAVTLTVNATTSTPPQALTAAPGNAQVSLSWSAPTSTGGSAITGYLINDKLAASSTYALATTTGASATSTVIGSLINGQLYDFEALAENGVGTSTPSNVATATPVSNVATLSNLTISTGTLTPTFSSSTMSYTDSVANSVTSVTVTPTATQASSTITVNSSTVLSGSASNPIALNVGSNTVLTVVTAQNGVAQDTYTITVTRTNVPSVAMTAPANLATVSSTVTISASSTAVSPASIASVQFYLDGSPLGSPVTTTSSPNTYSYSWNTASSTNGTHTIYALATDNYSNSATSTSIMVTVQNQAFLSITTSTSLAFSAAHGSTSTSPQSIVIVNAGTASSTLNWSATSTQPWLTFSPASSSLAGGASTTVNFIVNPSGLPVGATSTTATISDPNASSSPQTLPVTLTIGATTSTPPQTLTAVPGNAQVSLSWSAPSSTGGSAITNYIINDKLAASSTYALATTTGASATSTVIGSLINGQLYDFEALAQNGVGTSTPSNIATATPQSNNATLSNLTVSTGTLNPAFSSGITSYTDNVANSVTSVTVTPTATQASSTITVNSSTVVSGSASSPIALNVGSNTVLTVVTAQNGVTQDTYTITVTRTNTPTVLMTAPTSTTVSGIVTISASSTAVSPASIASVQFYLDSSSTLLGTATSSPYTISWNTASATNGAHTIYALATDNYSNTATSTSITVTVQNQAFLSVTTSTSLSFTAAHGSTAPQSQSVVIVNAGTASSTLNWSATSIQPWLTFSPASSSLAGGASTTVNFIVNPATLSLGTWNATATIADPNASSSPQSLPVTLTISSTGISVSMTSPTNGATVTSTISVSANPTSTAGIASLQFLLDGAPLGSLLTSAPYTTPWNTALSSNGSHILAASTTDADGNVATSSPVTVTVQNQAFLSVTTSTSLSFTAAHGSTAPQSQSVVIANAGTASSTLNWSASSPQVWLTFSPASSLLAGGSTTTVSFIANPTNLALGTYNATATIADPNASSSPQTIPVSLTVSATGIGTSITSPSSNASVTGIVPITATATSTVGISSVQFYLDGTLLGTATSSPYTISWNAYISSNGSHTLYALATDNDANTATSTSITVTVSNAPSTIISVGGGYGIPNYGTAPAPTPSTTPASSAPSSSGTTSLSLANQLKALQSQLAALQALANIPTSSTTPFVFTRNLGLWDRGADVRALQEFLVSQASGPAAGKLKAHGVSQVFGFLTYNALVEFQKKAGIVPASGYFGPKTRAYVNAHD